VAVILLSWRLEHPHFSHKGAREMGHPDTLFLF